ncbi:hypothetical protein GCM10023189_60470 [Nibrella saemangeumensis]|uniref:histidine kinase n=1 Tax=Nibrella saemangeumensis TaxID=1084526 RepID=A0ABP8NQU9_9BACT
MKLKAIAPYLFSFLLLIIVVFIDRYSFNAMQEYIAEVDHTREVITSLERLANHLKSAQLYSPSYAGTSRQNYYQLYKQEADSVSGELVQLQYLVRDDTAQTRRIASLARLTRKHLPVLMNRNIVEIIQTGEAWRLNDLFTIHSSINKAVDIENAQLSAQKKKLDQSTTISSYLTTIFSVLAIGIILIAFGKNLALSRRRRWLEGFLESVLNTSRNGVISCQAVRQKNQIVDFQILFANYATNDLLGAEPDLIIGKKLTELSPVWQDPEVFERFVSVVESGQPQQFESLYQRKGEPIWLYVVLGRLNDGLTATFHDITELKRYQEDLQLNIHQLSRSNENLQQFAYVASHDLQEPLRKIQSFSSIIVSRYQDQIDEEGKSLLTRLQYSAERMQRLVQDLLTYSRLTTQPLRVAPVSLSAVVSEVMSDLDMIIQEKQADVTVDVLPVVPGDAMQLRQLFQNLLSNALKFVAPGAPPIISIKVRLSVKPDDLPEHERNKFRSYVAIDVADNGIGFDLKYQERIFQLFQRLHGRSQYEGTGIGLAVCRKVVDNHHGHISISSKPGHGTTFTVYLPVS